MSAVLAFSGTLFLAVLVSQRASRTVLSVAVLFLLSGFVFGPGALGVLQIGPEDPLVTTLSQIAMVSVLFTDGMRINGRDLRRAWQLPGRALLLGMPLTFGVLALFGRYVAGLSWAGAFLVGAVLSPTDPVFTAAIVGREEIPWRLRHLLNVESGMNDGLALPMVLVLLAIAGAQPVNIDHWLIELGLGVVIGVAVPWLSRRIEQVPWFRIYESYAPLYSVAVGILVYATAALIGANQFLAAFFAGITLASVRPAVWQEFHAFAEPLVELIKLAALFVFAALLTPRMFAEIGVGGYCFAVLALVVARPAGIVPALAGSGLTWREQLTAAWFGPKGFASIVYGILVLRAQVHQTDNIFDLIAVVVALSIIAHSSTDVVFARWFCPKEALAEPGEPEDRPGAS